MPDAQNTLEYIEAYFTQTLSEAQKKDFEVRVVQDTAFAKEVAFYITARSAVRESLMEKDLNEVSESAVSAGEPVRVAPVRKIPLRKWLPYAAAACVIFIVAALFLFRSPGPEQLAAQYVKDNFSTLHPTLDASRDSLQVGIAAYNEGDYQKAIAYFEGIRQRDPSKDDVIEYAGLVYLQIKNYDKALEYFKELSAMELKYNIGDFLQAITLLQRNNANDKENARVLLEKVVEKKEDGSDAAQQILKKLK